MTKQVKNLKHLQSEIDSALSLISNKGKSLTNVVVPKEGLIAGTESLLERCEKIVCRKSSFKPVMRTVHHFACSGGTVLSKCIASMPNTFLISEVHPTTNLAINPSFVEFRPTDITSLGRYAKLPKMDDLAEKMFLSQIEVVDRHLNAMSCKLVLREHTHSDYCLDDESAIAEAPVLVRLFKENYLHRKLATVRNPIDSFMSLQNNGWVHFSPPTLDQYCKRFLAFVSHFRRDEIVKYEDFVAQPKAVMEQIAKILDIEYSPDFEDVFSIFNVTGDSGRSGDHISARARREVTRELQEEIENSENYNDLKEFLQY